MERFWLVIAILAVGLSAPACPPVLAQVAPVDLRLSAAESDDPVLAGERLVYSFTIENLSADSAAGVAFSTILPYGVLFDPSGAPDTCQETLFQPAGFSAPVICQFNDLPSGESLAFNIPVFIPAGYQTGHLLELNAVVSSQSPDPDPLNNEAVLYTTVRHIDEVFLPLIRRD